MMDVVQMLTVQKIELQQQSHAHVKLVMPTLVPKRTLSAS
ncbi:unnamed protein product, partial [Rotaria magnacalcarata]